MARARGLPWTAQHHPCNARGSPGEAASCRPSPGLRRRSSTAGTSGAPLPSGGGMQPVRPRAPTCRLLGRPSRWSRSAVATTARRRRTPRACRSRTSAPLPVRPGRSTPPGDGRVRHRCGASPSRRAPRTQIAVRVAEGAGRVTGVAHDPVGPHVGEPSGTLSVNRSSRPACLGWTCSAEARPTAQPAELSQGR